MEKLVVIKLGVIACIFICSLGRASQMEKQSNTVEMNKNDNHFVSVGRGKIIIPEDFKESGGEISYNDLDIVEKDNFSQKSFDTWVDNRWIEIKSKYARLSKDNPPVINRLSPYMVWFKFDYSQVDDDIAYKGEGVVWNDNKAIFLSPGGMFTADKKIPKIIDKIKPKKGDERSDYFCGKYFCIEVPPSNNEEVSVVFDSLTTKGLKLSVKVNTLYDEQRSFRLGDIFNNKKEIDGVSGIQSFLGDSERSSNGTWYTSISSVWYYPGETKNSNLPEITITLTYEYETGHKPSKAGWFDDQTIKETGFTPEKFMSIWESTLTSFKRSR